MITGDFNGASRIDLAVSGRALHGDTVGKTYLFYNDGSIPTTAATADVTITGETTGNSFGTSLASGDWNTFIFLGAREGDVTLAANQVLLQFLEITAYALDGFAYAAEALVGQAVGQRRPAAVLRAASLTLFWCFAGALILGLAFALFSPALIDLMATDPTVRTEARHFLPWIVAGPLIGSAAWTYDGIYIGATLTRTMRNLMIICVAIYLAALALLVPAFGNHGLWAALAVLNLSRSFAMWRRAPEAEAKAATLPAIPAGPTGAGLRIRSAHRW